MAETGGFRRQHGLNGGDARGVQFGEGFRGAARRDCGEGQRERSDPNMG